MQTGALTNLVDPAILFFLLGIFIALVRSNLEIPAPIVKFLSLYLLMAIGFKGGQALAATGFNGELGRILLGAVVLALLIPALSFLVLRTRTELFDAAAIAATYGSVSAVTFIAASSFLERQDVAFSGAMTVALVVMESPAIIMAVFLAAWVRSRHPGAGRSTPATAAGAEAAVVTATAATATATSTTAATGTTAADPRIVANGAHGAPPADTDGTSQPGGATPADPDTPAPHVGLKPILHEAFTDGAHLLLIGSLIVGLLTTADGAASMAPFTEGLFQGILALFLLEMGLLVARELQQLNVGRFLLGYGLVMPLVSASIAIGLAYVLGLGTGDAILLTVLGASASYIVVPAVVRYAIPEARPSRYFGLALGVTFPFNIVVGIPLYHAVVTALW